MSIASFTRRDAMRLGAAAACAAMPFPVSAAEIAVSQWGNSLSGLPYAIAMERGMFKAAGIDIDGIVGSGGGGTTLRNTLAGALPYGEVNLAAVLAAKRQGIDIVMVNTGFRTFGDSYLLVRPDSDVKSLADLAGKKVAITQPRSLSETLLLMSLRAQGVDPASVTRVASGGYGQGLTMLDQGAVAAAPLIVPLLNMRKGRYRVLLHYKDVLPAQTGNVGVTERSFAKSRTAEIKAIIAGRRAAVAAIYAEPKTAAAALAKFLNIPPDIAEETTDQMIAAKMWSEGAFNIEELDRAADGLRLVGEIKETVDWTTIIDRSYLPADLQNA